MHLSNSFPKWLEEFIYLKENLPLMQFIINTVSEARYIIYNKKAGCSRIRLFSMKSN
jgi:hypothetical protein